MRPAVPALGAVKSSFMCSTPAVDPSRTSTDIALLAAVVVTMEAVPGTILNVRSSGGMVAGCTNLQLAS